MPDDASPTGERDKPISRFTRDVLRSAIVDIVAQALTAGALGLLLLLALLVWQGGSLSVPAWAVALVLLLTVLAAHSVHRRHGELTRAATARAAEIRELEPLANELDDLQSWADTMEGAVARFEVYTQHVAEVLDHLQRVVAGDIGVSIQTYIERGILQPARDILMELPAEHVRLSVLLPDGERECFEMYFAAGHSISGQSKYRVPIGDTLSRIAYETGEVQSWDDVTTDDRFVQNPQASMPTKTMASLPLRNGDLVIGVFNAISSQPSAFDPAEARYLASLASVISVAVGILLKHAGDA